MFTNQIESGSSNCEADKDTNNSVENNTLLGKFSIHDNHSDNNTSNVLEVSHISHAESDPDSAGALDEFLWAANLSSHQSDEEDNSHMPSSLSPRQKPQPQREPN